MLNQPLLDRLVCAKYLFDSSSDVLSRGKPYAAGMAVLGLQDAAEMVLRVIAEFLHAPVKETTAFNLLMDEIEKLGKGTLSHRTALNQLNKSRVNFKHVGLEPREADVRKFRGDLAAFFQQACQTFLDVDFESLSLTSLIGHRRSRNWIERAEGALEKEEFRRCVTYAAVGLRVFQRNWTQGDEDLHERKMSLRLGHSSREMLSAANEIADAVTKQFEMVHEKLDLVAQGVSYSDFRRFDDLAPWVMISIAGTVQAQQRSHRDPDLDDALFCLNFVRDVILKVQGTYRSNRWAPKPGNTRYRTTREAPLIAYPEKDDRETEVIETLPEGTELLGWGQPHHDKAHTALFYQGDCVYVASEALELMPETP